MAEVGEDVYDAALVDLGCVGCYEDVGCEEDGEDGFAGWGPGGEEYGYGAGGEEVEEGEDGVQEADFFVGYCAEG